VRLAASTCELATARVCRRCDQTHLRPARAAFQAPSQLKDALQRQLFHPAMKSLCHAAISPSFAHRRRGLRVWRGSMMKREVALLLAICLFAGQAVPISDPL
jgi:hypothetical protein